MKKLRKIFRLSPPFIQTHSSGPYHPAAEKSQPYQKIKSVFLCPQHFRKRGRLDGGAPCAARPLGQPAAEEMRRAESRCDHEANHGGCVWRQPLQLPSRFHSRLGATLGPTQHVAQAPLQVLLMVSLKMPFKVPLPLKVPLKVHFTGFIQGSIQVSTSRSTRGGPVSRLG